jgi:pimeloyl-ACP methyl ester carboxylesterase
MTTPSCPAPAASCLLHEQVVLADVLARFDAEAVRGEFWTGRYRCRYYVWGSGPPLVFIPGLADDALSFVLPISLLSRHFRCIAYDQASGGEDGARMARYQHRDFVLDLLALVDQLRLRQAYLFGSSFGSTVALAALHQCPGRFPRGILQGGFARRPLSPAEVLLASFARYWKGQTRRLPLRTSLLQHVHGGPFAGRSPDIWNFFLTRWGTQRIAAVARRGLVLHRTDLRPLLPAIRQPLLLVCGDADPLVGGSCEEELLAGLPAATRVVLDNCGHVPMYTHPEVLAEVVQRFLTPPPRAVAAQNGERNLETLAKLQEPSHFSPSGA